MVSPLSASVSLDGYHRRRHQNEARANDDEHDDGSVASLASSSSVKTRSCLAEQPRSSRRSIYRSSLGKPPGTPSQQRAPAILPPTPPPATPNVAVHPAPSSSSSSASVSASSGHAAAPQKSIPMKELENVGLTCLLNESWPKITASLL